MTKETQNYCPVYDSIELLQAKWVLHIVRSLLAGPHGFNELSRAVGGANTTTLSQRLDHLERLGLVEKTIESTMPPKTRYELTQAGRELESIIDAIDTWARRHMRRCQEHDSAGSDPANAGSQDAPRPATRGRARTAP